MRGQQGGPALAFLLLPWLAAVFADAAVGAQIRYPYCPDAALPVSASSALLGRDCWWQPSSPVSEWLGEYGQEPVAIISPAGEKINSKGEQHAKDTCTGHGRSGLVGCNALHISWNGRPSLQGLSKAVICTFAGPRLKIVNAILDGFSLPDPAVSTAASVGRPAGLVSDEEGSSLHLQDVRILVTASTLQSYLPLFRVAIQQGRAYSVSMGIL